jgi:hypothetical protein
MADKPNPICIVCWKSILPGAPRYRRGLTSVHADCDKHKKQPQAVRPKTACCTRLIPRRRRMAPEVMHPPNLTDSLLLGAPGRIVRSR